MRYKAFISYSHADQSFSEKLESAIQRFGKAWHQQRARRVFRDASNIPVGPLQRAITEALRESEYFLLVASEAAASSDWVRLEIESWLEFHGTENLLLVVADGHLKWIPGASCFDRDRTTALPSSLLNAFPEEPLHVDMTWSRDSEKLTLQDPDFKKSVAQLAATLDGRSIEDMIGEEIEQHKRTGRVRRAAVTLLSALLALAIVLGGLAAWQTRIAQQQRDEARLQRDRAQARQLADASADALDRREWSLAGLLAIESIRRDRTPQGFEAWQRAMEVLPPSSLDLPSPGPVTDLRFIADGTLLLGRSNGSLLRWDLSASAPKLARRPHQWGANPRDHATIAFDSTGERFVTTDGERISLWAARTFESAVLGTEGTEALSVAISPDGQWIAAVFRGRPGLRIWYAERTEPLIVGDIIENGEAIMAYAFSPNSRLFAAGTRTSLHVWDLAAGREVALEKHPRGRAWGPIAFSPDSRWLVNWQGGVWLMPGGHFTAEVRRGSYRTPLVFSSSRWLAMNADSRVEILEVGAWKSDSPVLSIRGEEVVFSPDDRWLAALNDGRVELADLADRGRPRRVEHVGVTNAGFSPDSKWLATAAENGTVEVWQAESLSEESRLSLDRRVSAFAFSPNGQWLATADMSSVKLWDVVSSAVEIRPGSAAEGARGKSVSAIRQESGRLAVVNGKTGESLFDVAHGPDLALTTFSPDGRWAAVRIPSQRRRVDSSGELWNLETMESRKLEAAPLAFTPDSRHLLAWSREEAGATLTLLRVDSPEPTRVWVELNAGSADYTEPAVAFSRDGRTMAIGTGARSRDRTRRAISGHLSVWDVANWNLHHDLAFDTPITEVDLSPDGSRFAIQNAGNLLVSDSSDDGFADLGASNAAPKFSIDGLRLLALDPVSGRLRNWNLETGVWPPSGNAVETELALDGAVVWSFSPDGHKLAVATRDGEIQLLDTDTAQENWRATHDGAISDLAFNGTGEAILSFSHDGHRIAWQTSTGVRLDEVGVWNGSHHLAALDRALAIRPIDDPIWDEMTGRYPVSSSVISRDSRYLITAGEDKVVSVWSIPDGRRIARLPHKLRSAQVALDPTGQWLAVLEGFADSVGPVCVWSTTTWSSPSCKPHSTRVEAVLFSEYGNYLATLGENNVRIWQPGRPGSMPVVRHRSKVRAAAFSADEQLIATTSRSGELGVWRLPSGEIIGTTTLDGTAVLARFSPRNEWLGLIVDSEIRVLKTETLQEVGRWVLADFHDVTFTPDGKSLLGSTVRGDYVLPWATDVLIVETCNRLPRNMSYSEWNGYMDGQTYQVTCPGFEAHPSLHAEADRRIDQGDFDGAVEMLNLIAAINDDDGSPMDAARVAAPALIIRSSQLVRIGQVKEAVVAYTRARDLNSDVELDFRVLNTLCWYGSLWREPRLVLDLCEQAVALSEQNARIRDSRGVARAMTGNYEEAIEDFASYVADPGVAALDTERRRSWIDSLRSGRDPFTSELLEALKGEPPEPDVFFSP